MKILKLHVQLVRKTPKKEAGTFRLIHDLSYPKGNSVNSETPWELTTVQYENFNTFTEILSCGPEALVAKAGIESAFRILPIHSENYRLLGFMWNRASWSESHQSLVVDNNRRLGTGSAGQKVIKWLIITDLFCLFF